MLFFEGQFFLFFAAVLFLSVVCFSRPRARLWVLLISSYVFYGAWDARFLLLIFGSTLVDYLVALRMPALPPAGRKPLLAISLFVNLGCLAAFKYADFGVGSLNALLGTDVPLLHLTLPVGISFFTFQSMSYTIDVYRGRLAPTDDFPTFALFVSFFPQLVAGPIIRASDFLQQAGTALRQAMQPLRLAAPLFIFGLFKKVVVADQLGLIVDAVFQDPAAFGSGDRWMAALAFSGQIYCDFSGYTDMALALGLLLGFRFPLNFKSPYLALGPQDFWRRWHISLSSWLRDYVYIPLGGSRRGPPRMYFALLLTMLVGGLWHGAAWTFVLWGAFHGTLLIVERLLGGATQAPRWTVLWRWPVFFGLTLVGWMIFRAESWALLAAMLDGLWVWQSPDHVPLLILGLGIGYVAVEHILAELDRRHGLTERFEWAALALAGLLLPLCFLLSPAESTEFIYFSF